MIARETINVYTVIFRIGVIFVFLVTFLKIVKKNINVNNKSLFEEWLTRFKRNINGKKFNAVKSYMRYMTSIEKHLGMEVDGIYEISDLQKLKQLESKLRKKDTFNKLAPKTQANLLSALHVYQNLMEILSNNQILNLENGKSR